MVDLTFEVILIYPHIYPKNKTFILSKDFFIQSEEKCRD